MGDYHDALRQLEELTETRHELMNRGARYAGIEKAIKFQIKQLHTCPGAPARAAQYASRLRGVREQLGSYIVEEMDVLIATQESLVPCAPSSNLSKLPIPNIQSTSAYHSREPIQSPPQTTAKHRVKWKDGMGALLAPAYAPTLTSHYHTTSPQQSASSSAETPAPSPTQVKTKTANLITPTSRPFYMFVNSITTQEKKYLNKISGSPFQIRVGGDERDEGPPFSHRLFSSPEMMEVIVWSRESNLVVVHSKNYVQYVTGDVMHIEALDEVEAMRFADFARQHSAKWEVKVPETNGYGGKSVRHGVAQLIPSQSFFE
ncbi:MAG: hypothetical protein Q9226_000144 [Calogaya cf. arnoldii]